MLSVAEKTAQIAEHIAAHNSHGYSQNNRAGDGTTETVTLSDGSKVTVHGGDYDCSEMVRVCVNGALSGNYKQPIDYLWTGNEDTALRSQGFTRYAFNASTVRRGDLLLVSGHTGVALGGGKQADAHGDEYGGITGPNKGDQTTHEVEVRALRTTWTYMYRYRGADSGAEVFPMAQKITFKKDTWIHSAADTKKSSVVGTYKAGESVTIDGVIINGGYAFGTYLGGTTGKRRYVVLGALERIAK